MIGCKMVCFVYEVAPNLLPVFVWLNFENLCFLTFQKKLVACLSSYTNMYECQWNTELVEDNGI